MANFSNVFQSTSQRIARVKYKGLYLMHGHHEGGLTAYSKDFKTPFFIRYWKILLRGYSKRSRTSTIFFLFKISQQIWLLEASKVLAEMCRCWQSDWAMSKIFFSNLRKHLMNKCWKFQVNILRGFRIMVI